MFNKYLLLCLTIIACNSCTHDERIERIMLNAHKNRIFDLNDTIESLQHKKEDVASLLANNQSSAWKMKIYRYATVLQWLYPLHALSNNEEFLSSLSIAIKSPSVGSVTNCLSNLVANKYFAASTLVLIDSISRISIESNVLSTNIRLHNQELARLDARIEKLMQEKRLLEESSKPDATTIPVQNKEQSDEQ